MDAYAHIVVDGSLNPKEVSLEKARTEIVKSLEYGAENVEDPALQISTKMNSVFFSDSWYQLPTLSKDFKRALGERKIFPSGSIWINEILTLLNEESLVSDAIKADIEVDPLSLNSWFYYAIDVYRSEGLESLREIVRESREAVGSNYYLDKVEHLFIALDGDKELLKSIYPNGVTDSDNEIPIFIIINAYLAASIDDYEHANELIDLYEPNVIFMDDYAVLTYYEMGRTSEAKALVRKLDGLPGGPTNLAISIASFGNRLYFELEDAQNTVTRFKEAGIDVSGFKKMPWVN
jgi:hypothetical protein